MRCRDESEASSMIHRSAAFRKSSPVQSLQSLHKKDASLSIAPS